MKRLLWLLPLLMACTTVHRPPQTDIREAQRRAIDDRVSWLGDSLPVVRFDPPYVYSMFKAQVEACSGVKKDGFPKFYIAPVAPLGSNYALAVFVPRQNVVVFALGSEVLPWVVRHELLHWLLAPRDTRDHPPEFFSADPTIGRCAPFITEA
jgi:hypothetical protein